MIAMHLEMLPMAGWAGDISSEWQDRFLTNKGREVLRHG